MADGEVATILSEWLLVALIVFTLVLEVLLHKLEHWIKHKHNHLVAVLRVLYRELMILGLISFMFIIYELAASPSGDTVLSFEFAHLFIFLLAIFYTIVVLFTMGISLQLSAKWKKMERMDLVHYLSLKEKYNQLKSIVNKRQDKVWHYIWWFPNISKLLHYSRLHEIMAFHDIRFQFIYYRELPEDFRFSSFLRKIKSITFLDLVESHWSLYVIFLVVVFCDIARRLISSSRASKVASGEKMSFSLPEFKFKEDSSSPPSSSPSSPMGSIIHAGEEDGDYADGDKESKNKYGEDIDAIFIICAAIALTISVQILAIKIRRVYWTITKHPRTYYEGVQAEAVEEELRKAAELRSEMRRRSRSRSVSLSRREDADTGNDADIDDEQLKKNKLLRQEELEQQYQQQLAESSEQDFDFESQITEMDPGNELLDPMRAPPLKSPLFNNKNDDNTSSGIPANASTNSLKDLISNANTMLENNEDDDGITVRHSLERSRNNRSMTDLAQLGQSHASGHGDHDEHDLTYLHAHGGHGDHDEHIARHSLDIPRKRNPNPPHGLGEEESSMASTAVSSTSTSLARAALQAAKQRARSEIPPASSSSLAQGSDTENIDSYNKKKFGSPRVTSPKTSRRGSIDEDAVRGASIGGSIRGSIDLIRRGANLNNNPNGGGGNRRSIELAVVMARHELAEKLDRPTTQDYENELLNDSRSSTDRRGGRDRNGNGAMSRRSLSPGDNNGKGIRKPSNNNREESLLSSVDSVGTATKKDQRIRFSIDTSSTVTNTIGGKNTLNGDVHLDMMNDQESEINTNLQQMDNDEETEEKVDRNNPTIMKYFEEHRNAENYQPNNYPRFITAIIPRLGRVATPVEKLFWFGSHKFFMWCVEFVIFFSTVVLAAATAGTVLIAVTKKTTGRDVDALHYICLCLAAANLVFVLLRIAVIIKCYIFILHNASLIPEVVALEAIQNVRQKRLVREDGDDESSFSGSETEMEDEESAKERRRKLGRFFRSEAESGNIPGIEGSKIKLSRTSWDFGARRRNKRRSAAQRRKLRLWKINNNNNDNDMTENDRINPNSEAIINSEIEARNDTTRDTVDNQNERESGVIVEPSTQDNNNNSVSITVE